MSGKTDPLPYRLRQIAADDVAAVHALYQDVFELTPLGFLSRRDRAAFETIFEAETFAGGVFLDDRLVGYKIYDKVQNLHFDERKYRRAAEIIASHRVLFGKGTVIAPAHQNRGLAARVSHFASELGRAAGYRYRLSDIFVANIGSARNVLKAGRTIVGLSTDEFGLNFITCGYLGHAAVRCEIEVCRADDLERIATVLEEHRIVAFRDEHGVPNFVIGDVVEFE